MKSRCSWDSSRIRAVLRHSAHFRDLPSGTQDRIAGLAKLRVLSDGQLASAPQDDSSFCIILAGAIYICLLSSGGHAVPIALLGQGGFFGLKALFGPSFSNSMECRSLGSTMLATVPTDAVRRLMGDDEVFRAHAVKLLISRLSASISTLADALHAPLPRRLARRLLSQALVAGTSANTIDITVSQRLMAEMLGASRSTVSEALKRLEKAGIVQRRYRKLRILDMERLTELAGEDIPVF